jgi:hypothetical protein
LTTKAEAGSVWKIAETLRSVSKLCGAAAQRDDRVLHRERSGRRYHSVHVDHAICFQPLDASPAKIALVPAAQGTSVFPPPLAT